MRWISLWLVALGCAEPPTPASAPTEVDACFLQDLDTCDQVAGCSVLEGRVLGEQAGAACIDVEGSFEPASCWPAELDCDDIGFVARSPDGVLFEFSSRCIPAAWEPLTVPEEYPDCSIP